MHTIPTGDFETAPHHAARKRQGSVAEGGLLYRKDFMARLAELMQPPSLDVHVCDHCNLSCAGCAHMAPVARPRLLDLDEYERDLASLAAIPGMGAYLRDITLMGGEPLLHPRLPDIVRLTREHLPETPIVLVSNGLLLDRAGDGFWDALASCGVRLFLSAYPIGIDYDGLLALAERRGVAARLNNDATGANDEGDKSAFFKLALDASGACDPIRSFNLCPFGGTCLQLRDRALWPCPVAAWGRALDVQFGCEMTPANDDRLPLAEIASTDQVERFRRRAHPFCRYCDSERLVVVPWARSERRADEWLVDWDDGCLEGTRRAAWPRSGEKRRA